MGKKNTVSRSTQRHPRVYVSRVQAPPRISRNADSIRERLRNGAKTVVVDTAGQLIELDDKTFASAGDEWTLRFTAGSQARIHLDSPLPATAHIVATDATKFNHLLDSAKLTTQAKSTRMLRHVELSITGLGTPR